MDDNLEELNDLSFEPAAPEWSAVQSFLSAAQALTAAGRHAEAEWRLRQALKQAEIFAGAGSDAVKRVLVAQMQFYLSLNRTDEAAAVAEQISTLKTGLTPKRRSMTSLLKRARPDSQGKAAPRIGAESRFDTYKGHMPPEVRRACQVLHITDDDLTVENVQKCWKKEVVEAQAHPDLGGEVELSVLLNNARDTILSWLESRAPKLGKLFENRTLK